MPTFNGTDDRDIISGTDADDVIMGLGGGDHIAGLDGDDELLGGEGIDSLNGGPGNDTLIGGADRDGLTGGDGDDLLIGGEGGDVHRGGAGYDTAIFDDAFADVAITTNVSILRVHGAGGDDLVHGDVEVLEFAGVPYSFDQVWQTGTPYLQEKHGTWWDEWLNGGDLNDRINGDGGNDVVRGFGGDDLLLGEQGDDTLVGGADDDTLTGGEGADVFSIRAGKWAEGDDTVTDFTRGLDHIGLQLADLLQQEPGLAALSGQADLVELSDLEASAEWTITTSGDGDVLIHHDSGSIELDGIAYGQGWESFFDLADVLILDGAAMPEGTPASPDAPPPAIAGNDWDEWLKGTEDADSLDGAGGNDVVRGYGGDDAIAGGLGDDTLCGEGGNDTLTGGEGADVFAIRAGKWGEGDDVIVDFRPAIDRIDLDAGDLLRGSPGLAGLSGDPEVIEASDFDASADWSLGLSEHGNLLVIHPTGTIELSGIHFEDIGEGFSLLTPFLTIDGEALPEGTPLGEDPACEDTGPVPMDEGGTISGTEEDDCLVGSNGDDALIGLGGDDHLRGYGGVDQLDGGVGNDRLEGGGGAVNVLIGGDGADTFLLHVSTLGQTQDQILDFERGADVLVIDAAAVAEIDPGLAALAGDADRLELLDLEASPDWYVSAFGTADGSVVSGIVHPGGAVIFENLIWYPATDDFADLADMIAFEGQADGSEADPVPQLVTGNDWNEWLKGTDAADALDAAGGDDVVRGYGGDDALFGGAGDDTLRGEAGDDTLTGGEGADSFRIRSGKWDQGDDVVTDFELGSDKLVFVAADMLEEDLTLAAAAGDDALLGLDDLDASDRFGLSASDDGDLLVSHQTGTVELDGIAFGDATDSFVELANLMDIEIA